MQKERFVAWISTYNLGCRAQGFAPKMSDR